MIRVLSEAEQAVLKAIFEQRAKSQWSPIFKYNPEEAQLYLHSIDAFSEYDLDHIKQYEIIDKLTDEGIIKTDYLVDTVFVNNYRAATGSELPKIESSERYFWRRNTEWAREHYGPNELSDMDKINEQLGGSILIYMTTADMRNIKKQYMASRVIRLDLKIYGDDCVLKIKFGSDEWKEILRMNKDKTTSKILIAAFDNANKETETEQKYLEKKVFAKNSTVLALNPILIELGVGKLTFKTFTKATPVDFESLKKTLKIA